MRASEGRTLQVGDHDERCCEKKPRDDIQDRRDARGLEECSRIEGDHAEPEDRIPKLDSARAFVTPIEA